MNLTVCLLASEVAPLSKTGGLGDVSGALAKYLHAAGHDVRLFTPFYSSIDRSRLEIRPVQGLQDVPLQLGTHSYHFSVFSTELPRSTARVFLIDSPELYSRPTLYTADADEHLRFLAFTRAVFASCQQLAWAPRILHCNDWHTAFGPLFLKAKYSAERSFAATRSLLTIHNIGYQGAFSATAVADLGLGANSYRLHQDDLTAGTINPLKHGIMYADAITTVSPTHAREICTDQYGMGMQQALRARGAALTGILNGVDYEEWDPRNDRFLPQPFDSSRLAVKAQLKRDFAASLGINSAPDVPLAGIVTRLASQKGIDLMIETLPKLLRARNFNFVALGSGDAQYERFLADLQEQFPGRVHFKRGYDDKMAHWIEAACDLFLMPSFYEPCGLNQMYSLRYGTVPVVRKTGGLADSVEHFDPATGQGTGIVFNDYNAQALEWAVNTALDLYAQPAHWARMVHNGMNRDFSWQKQGGLYVQLYEKMLRS